MLTDQKQYLRYMQITSDAICFILIYTILNPAIITVYRDYGLLFTDTTLLFNNACIYKSTLYFTWSWIAVAGAFVGSALSTIPAFFFTNRSYQFILVPFCLTLLNWYLLRKLLLQFPEISDQTDLILITSETLVLLLLLLSRINIFTLLKQSGSHHVLIKHIVLAGIDERSLKLAQYIREHPASGLRFSGFLSTETEKDPITLPDFKILGHLTDLPTVIHSNVIDIVMTLDSTGLGEQLNVLFRTCATMGMEFACPTPIEGDIGKASWTTEVLGNNNLIRYRFVNTAPLSIFMKRIFDFTASSLLILCCLPFWIVVPLMIKSSSRGPIFFRQERIGKCGRKFTLYKFRSMHENAESIQDTLLHLNEMDGPAFKIKEDPRQTPTGRVLRKHSLDELPQLFNVVKGDISLVGPRPAIGDEVIQYRLSERRRLSVIQGITCIWQVSGRNEIKFDEWMKLDLMYIDTWSYTSDFKILFKTIPAVLVKRGAY